MSSKSKSGLSDTPSSKVTPATPRISKVSRGVTKSESDTSSPLPKPRVSIERSPRTVTSKPTADRRSPKVTDSGEVTSKPTVERRLPKVTDSGDVTSKRSPKVTDSAEVNSKPTVDRRSPKLSDSAERPASRLVKVSELQAQLNIAQEELKTAKEQIASIEKDKAVALDELKEAQKSADCANEKLRDALVAQKRAEESSEIEKFRAIELEQSGIEAVKKKEEEWMKENESVRNQHAMDVSALLTATQELQKLQQDLAMALDAKQQALTHADDATKIAEIHAENVQALNEELARVKKMLDSKLEIELEKAKAFEEKVTEREAFIEQLNVELEAAKMAESYACSLVEEWKNRVEELEVHVEEANKQERSASESLNSLLQQLEQKTDLLHDAESESTALSEKVGFLEMTVATQKANLLESEQKIRVFEEEIAEMEKTMVSLKSELEKTKEEEEKRQKAMESLASALHEASSEARESKEKLLSLQIEHETCETQMEDLQLVLKATNEKYETLLDNSRHEIDLLNDELDQSKAEWEHKEHELMEEKGRLVNLLRHAEKEAQAAMVEESKQRDSVKKLESDASLLRNSLGDAKAESLKLQETLIHKKTELQSFARENEEIRAREAAFQKEKDRLVNLLRHAEKEAQAAMVEESKQRDSVKKLESDASLLYNSLGDAKAESLKLKETLIHKETELQGFANENEEIRAREAAFQKEKDRLVNLLRHAEKEAQAAMVEESKQRDSVKKLESDASLLHNSLGDAKAESLKLKETLIHKENELQSFAQENEEIRAREAAALKKIETLSNLLEEAQTQIHKPVIDNGDLTDSEKLEADASLLYSSLGDAKAESLKLKETLIHKETELQEIRAREAAALKKIETLSNLLETQMHKPVIENGDLTDSEKEYDMLPKVVEFSEENGHSHGGEDKNMVEMTPNLNDPKKEESGFYDESAQIAMGKMGNGKSEEHKEEDDSLEEEYKMWESCKIEKELSPEKDSVEDVEVESKADSVEQGGNSPSKEVISSSSQKKKKPLLKKIGSLLKKKGSSTTVKS